MRPKIYCVLLPALLLFTASPAFAPVPIPAAPPPPPFQALLLESDGAPRNGSHDVRLRFMSALRGGTLLHEITHAGDDAIDILDGLLRAPLTAPGKGLPDKLVSALRDGRPVYLEAIIGGDLLEPRVPVVASTDPMPQQVLPLPPGGLLRGPAPEAIEWCRSNRLTLYGGTGTPGEVRLEIPITDPDETICDPEDDTAGREVDCDRWLSPAGERPDAAALRRSWDNYMRNGPLGYAPPGAFERAWERRLEMESTVPISPDATSQSFVGDTWVNLGPAPLIAPNNVHFNGRVRAVAVDRIDPDIIYVGAASGGVWKTTDGGVSWTPLTDFEEVLSTGSIALDPQEPSIIYVGTGEYGAGLPGAGVLKSIDGGNTWSLKGEIWFNNRTGGERVGRIALDPRPVTYPATQRIVFLAGVSGVWRSPDGGETWLRAIAGNFSDLLIDPIDPNIVYAASPDFGIWKSTTSGVPFSWNQIIDADQELPTTAFGRMQLAAGVDPVTSSTILFASAEDQYVERAFKGIWKSTDGGNRWERVTGHPVRFARGLSVMPDMFESVSNDTFATADEVAIGQVVDGTISSATDVDFFEVDVTGNMLNIEILADRMGSPLDPMLFLYDSSHDPVLNRDGVALGGNKGFKGSNDERLGMSGWTILTPGTHYIEVRSNSNGPSGPYQLSVTGVDLGCQCEYDQVLAVDPNDPDILYAGLIRLLRSTDGGKNWSDIHDHGGDNRVHPDIQAMAFHPTDSNTMFWGTDGGLFKTTDAGAHWQSLNTNLSLIQIYRGMTQDKVFDDPILIGMQDNGAAVYRLGKWTQIRSGDGTYTAVANIADWYVSDLNLKLLKLTAFGQNRSNVPPPWRDGTHPFTPFVMHPGNPDILIGGVTRGDPNNPDHVVARTDDGADSWTRDDDDLGAQITALAFAPSDPTTQYAGTDLGTIWRTLDNGDNWHQLHWFGRPVAGVNDLVVAPDDKYRVYVAYGGWITNQLFRVHKDGTGGAVTGVAIDQPPHSLNPAPAAPAWAVVVDHDYPDTILLGNEVGIFLTTDGGQNWRSFNRGLPNVPVRELVLSPSGWPDGMLRAATFGRGVWDLQVGNDLCDNATLITDGSYAGSTIGATRDGESGCEFHLFKTPPPDAFYEYVTPCGGVVTVDTCGSSYNTALSLHSNTCPAWTGTELACDDDCLTKPCTALDSCITRPAVPGERLKIRVGGSDGQYGDFKLNVSCTIPNDSCDAAPTINLWESILGSTVGAISDGAPSCNGVDVTSAGVWYRVIGTGNTMTALLCAAPTDFDTKLTVYCAGCGGQSCITANDDACGTGSQVSWCSAPGAIYHLFVHGAGSQSGTFQLDVDDGASCPFVRSCAPANNNCEQAQEITLSTSVGDNTNAGTSMQASCEDSSSDVWFRWESRCNGFVTFDTCGTYGSLADTVLSLHDSCGGLEYACNDDSPGGCGWRSQVSYPAIAGSEFKIRVADFDPGDDPDVGDFPLHHDFITTGLAVPKPGLYLIDAAGATADHLVHLDNEFYTSIHTGPTGTTGLTGLAWAPDLGLMYGVDTASDQMVTIDLQTGMASPFGLVGFGFLASLAWDAYERVLYGFDAPSGNLIRIDAISGEGTAIGPVGFSQVGSLALDPRRRILYGVDLVSDFLLTIDLSTGAGANVGPLGGTIDRVEGLTFDPVTRTLLGLQRDISTNEMRIVRIDPGTGMAVEIGPRYIGIDGRALEFIPGLPDATAGDYFATHIDPNGGCPAYDYADWNGVPPGLTADAYGTIRGIPDEPGDHLLTFTLNDTAPDIDPIETSIPLRIRPPNDRCADAPLVADGGYPYATVGATTDGPDASAACAMDDWRALQGDVWYCYRAPCSGTLTALTCESDFDTMLAVYPDCACWDGAAPLACDDDSCGVSGAASRVDVPVIAGGHYGIRVGGYGVGRGHGVVGFECAGDPAGACCRAGSCGTETSADCAVGGGLWLGDGSVCTPDGDTDGDALPDLCDACPQDPYKQADPGVCGCGVLDRDTDADSTPDCIDSDDDGDGVPDDEDLSPSDRYRCRDADQDGCDDCTPGYTDPAADGTDMDADGFCDARDCDDGWAFTYPGAQEVNDGVDNNCPGDLGYLLVDELSEPIGFFTPFDTNELSWTPQPGAADYQIVRSDDFLFNTCLVWQHADPVWLDYENPASGQAFFYLVRPLVPHPGSWGYGFAEVERTVPCASP